MARNIPASFFVADEVLFIGYSKRNAAFSAEIRTAFESRGMKVYPVNPNPGDYDVEVYPSVARAPGNPELAVVMINKARQADLLEALAAKGVKRVLFGSRIAADAATLESCAALGLDYAVACPLQALGTGFHRFHGWISGVPKVASAR